MTGRMERERTQVLKKLVLVRNSSVIRMFWKQNEVARYMEIFCMARQRCLHFAYPPLPPFQIYRLNVYPPLVRLVHLAVFGELVLRAPEDFPHDSFCL